jgi:two-component system OmpR family response regulator
LKPRKLAERHPVMVAPAYLEPLRSLLSDMSWEIEVARSSSAIREALSDGRPRVLVLGADLPDGDGFEFCESLKREGNHHSTRIIMVTHQNEDDQQLRAFKAGADEILTMPISRYQLVLRVQAQLLICSLGNGASRD